jgi:hypothetical protein
MKEFAGDGVLFKDGDPYRGIGVNCFDAFARTLAAPNDTSHGVGLIPTCSGAFRWSPISW